VISERLLVEPIKRVDLLMNQCRREVTLLLLVILTGSYFFVWRKQIFSLGYIDKKVKRIFMVGQTFFQHLRGQREGKHIPGFRTFTH